MNGGAQAFRQPVKADRRFEPAAIIDAFHVIQNIAAIEHGARFTKSKRLHFLGRGVFHVARALLWLRLAAFVFTHQLNSRMDDVAWPLPAVSGSFNSACMVAQATSACLASSVRLAS